MNNNTESSNIYEMYRAVDQAFECGMASEAVCICHELGLSVEYADAAGFKALDMIEDSLLDAGECDDLLRLEMMSQTISLRNTLAELY
jgi:hypothetical protein